MLSFTLSAPQYLAVQIDQLDKIFVFADPLEVNPPTISQAGVVDVSSLSLNSMDNTMVIMSAMTSLSAAGGGVMYFPPGVYPMGTLDILSNVHVYLAGGAVLLGTTNFTSFTSNHGCTANVPSADLVMVRIYNRTNVTLSGRGTIDGNGYQSIAYSNKACTVLVSLLNIAGGTHIAVRGVIERAGTTFSNYIGRSRDVLVDRLKLVQYECEGNTDGLEVADSSDVTVQNTFIHNGDDAFTVQAYTSTTLPFWLTEYKGATLQPYNTSNILFTDNVIWSAASAYRIGANVDAPIQNITFQNTQVIQSSGLYAYLTAKGDAAWVNDVTFENITMHFVKQLRGSNGVIYMGTTGCVGNMSNFLFKNIVATNIPTPEVVLCGAGTNYHIFLPNVQSCDSTPVGLLTNVTLDNVSINGAGVGTIVTGAACNGAGIDNLVSGIVVKTQPPPATQSPPPSPSPAQLPSPGTPHAAAPAPRSTQSARDSSNLQYIGICALIPALTLPAVVILATWTNRGRRR